MSTYNLKIEIMGNVLQIRRYEKPIIPPKNHAKRSDLEIHHSIIREINSLYEEDETDKSHDNNQNTSTEQQRPPLNPTKDNTLYTTIDNIQRSARRARQKLSRITSSNFGFISRDTEKQDADSLKFLTLTYKENMTDRERASKDWEKFIKRLEYRLKAKTQYIAVPEQQKRGAWHFHSIIKCPFIPLDDLKDIWNKERGEGSFNIQKIDDIGNVGSYISKYISKQVQPKDDDPSKHYKKNKRRYLTSRGMSDKTIDFKTFQANITDEEIEEWLRDFTIHERTNEYTSEYTGIVKFQELTLLPTKESQGILESLQNRLLQGESDPQSLRLNIFHTKSDNPPKLKLISRKE